VTFEHSILIRATPDQLFALTQDYGRRLEWDCFLKAAYLLDGATSAGLGVRANCVARIGLAMETEYVSFSPPRVTAVKMTRGPWFIDSFAGSWHFHDEGAGQTRVSFAYHVRAWPRWLAPLLTPVLAHVFARDTRKRLGALKLAVEERGLVSNHVEAAPHEPNHGR
jgi:ribosome-associated toxin RatA of RatAB toxin-antitoxin module